MRSASDTYGYRVSAHIVAIIALGVSIHQRAIIAAVASGAAVLVFGLAACVVPCPRCGESVIRPGSWTPRPKCLYCGLETDSPWPERPPDT